MRDDQTCWNCEWWDKPEMERHYEKRCCFRWPGDPWLRTEKHQKCWQWCARGKGGNNPSVMKMHPEDVQRAVLDPEPGGVYRAIRMEPDGHEALTAKEQLEAAVQLVLEAGVSTGHADNCAELVEELLRDRRELKAKIGDLEFQVAEETLSFGSVNEARRLLELRVRGLVKDIEEWDRQVWAWLKGQP